VIWFDRRMGPAIGTNERVNKADIRALDDKHNFDCWDTTRNTTRLLLCCRSGGLLKYHVVGDPHYRGNALALRRRTTPRCWSSAPPGSNGSWTCGRAVICSRPMS
jgi:hypothetical protein